MFSKCELIQLLLIFNIETTEECMCYRYMIEENKTEMEGCSGCLLEFVLLVVKVKTTF